MLREVLIQNFALIEKAEISFEEGLNIVTGETGAGKSILIGALSMLLGERAGIDQIRSGSDKAIIEGQFDVRDNTHVMDILSEHSIESPVDRITVRRELNSKGQNRCFLNDALVSLGILKQVGDGLADLHGQHDHQSLLRPEVHLDLLDGFGELETDRRRIEQIFDLATAHDGALRDLMLNKEKHVALNELYRLQLKELDDLAPELGEDDRLLSEERVISNSEQLFATASRAYEDLYDREDSILAALSSIHNLMEKMNSMDPATTAWKEHTENSVIVLQELANELAKYKLRVQFDPERLEGIRERLLQLQRLKKKYGSIEAAIEKQNELHELTSANENFEFEIGRLKKSLFEESGRLLNMAEDLSKNRLKAAREFDRQVVAEMKKLGMDHVRFVTALKPISSGRQLMLDEQQSFTARSTGLDEAEFLLSTNLGEDVKPLSRVASGGEISRIMLAIKTVMAKADRIPTLVFDEIDVGISGRIAQVVGRSLLKLGRSRQVICITHLPQVACMSNSHYSVVKYVEAGKSITSIRKLSSDEKLLEIAKLLSGDKVTPAVLNNARELLSSRGNLEL